MESARAVALRRLLTGTGWVERTRAFGAGLRAAPRSPGGLLLVGTPRDEPWHLAAHLSDDARRAGRPELVPTLVRHRVPPGARPHLAVGLDRLHAAGRGEAVLVVADSAPGEQLLERVADARRRGTTVFSIDRGEPDLADLAHEALAVPSAGLLAAGPGPPGQPVSELVDPVWALDVVQHLVSVAATEPEGRGGSRWGRLLARLGG